MDELGFTVERYAHLCVDIELEPQRVAEILAHYRLLPLQKRALDERWAERMSRDPGVFLAWDRERTLYRAFRTR